MSVAQAQRSEILVDETATLSPLHAMLTGIRMVLPDDADDIARANAILNHESVLPFVSAGHEPPLDLAPIIGKPQNAVLLGDHGYMMFTPAHGQDSIYEAHTSVLPEGRGPWALLFVRACLHWIFTTTPIVEVYTRCPHLENLPSTRRMSEAVGASLMFEIANGYPYNGELIPADIYGLTIFEWAQSAPGLVERGGWFHKKLEAEYRKLGRKEPNHDDDEAHDRYVGAAAEMIFGGQAGKGVVFYNRFAAMAGYEPIRVVNINPLMLDIRDAYLIVRGMDFWVHSLKDRPEREEH